MSTIIFSDAVLARCWLQHRLESLQSECGYVCEFMSDACVVVTFRHRIISFAQFRKVLDVVRECEWSGYIKASGDFVQVVMMPKLNAA